MQILLINMGFILHEPRDSVPQAWWAVSHAGASCRATCEVLSRQKRPHRRDPGEGICVAGLWDSLGAVSSLHTGWSLNQRQGLTAPCISSPVQALILLPSTVCQTRVFSLSVTSNLGSQKEKASSQWDRPLLLRTKSGCGGNLYCPGKDRWGSGSNVNDT